MDKTTKEQVNNSFELPLWDELSDEAADAYVGGRSGLLFSRGEVRGYLQQFRRNVRIYRRLFRQS
jgi:hypothetical protein